MEAFYTKPLRYIPLIQKIRELKRKYPFISVESIGKTHGGLDIFSLSILPRESCTLICATTHASEWLTALAGLRFFEHQCEKVKKMLLLDDQLAEIPGLPRGVTLIPCLNPDGVEIANGVGYDGVWQANGKGVDINHNFDAGWQILQRLEQREGITGPGPTRYGGTAPQSEPETQAAADFCKTFNPKILLTLHSQGEEIFWHYGGFTPRGSLPLAKKLCEVSGYKLVMPKGLNSHGGFKDWFIKTLRAPGFTIEMGKGKNPLPIEQFSEFYKPVKAILKCACATII